MPSREEIEKYRNMTVAEKLRLTVRMTDEALSKLLKRPPRVIDRVFEMIRRDNDSRNRTMLECIARANEPRPPGPAS